MATPNGSSRRSFLKKTLGAGAFTLVGSAGGLGIAPLTAWGLPGDGSDTVIVNVFLRGGADGLNIVVPHGDPAYYKVRPSIGLHSPDYVDLDGFFGLATAYQDLKMFYDTGSLAFVHCVGLPSDAKSKSHFVSQPRWDTGLDTGGWMARAVTAGNADFAAPMAGVTIGHRTSRSLAGLANSAVVSSIEGAIDAEAAIQNIRPAIESMYTPTTLEPERSTVASMMTALDQASALTSDDRAIETYMDRVFAEAAVLISADIGVRTISLNFGGGWDTHRDQLPTMKALGEALGGALYRFQKRLGIAHTERVVTVVMSEFGRTVPENGTAGTDHGWGNLMMVLGSPLAQTGAGGGQVHVRGSWPSLFPNVTDLPATTDFRDVLAELVDRHLGLPVAPVFPGYTPTYHGLLAPPAPPPPPLPIAEAPRPIRPGADGELEKESERDRGARAIVESGW